MFTTPCFIRKNTTKIIERLVELGYTMFDNYMSGNALYIYNDFENKPYCTAFYSLILEVFYPKVIDCSENKELFLAIAAF